MKKTYNVSITINWPPNRFPRKVKKFLKREPAEMKIEPSLCPYMLPDGKRELTGLLRILKSTIFIYLGGIGKNNFILIS